MVYSFGKLFIAERACATPMLYPGHCTVEHVHCLKDVLGQVPQHVSLDATFHEHGSVTRAAAAAHTRVGYNPSVNSPHMLAAIVQEPVPDLGHLHAAGHINELELNTAFIK